VTKVLARVESLIGGARPDFSSRRAALRRA
jgi:hypothetical protein